MTREMSKYVEDTPNPTSLLIDYWYFSKNDLVGRIGNKGERVECLGVLLAIKSDLLTV